MMRKTALSALAGALLVIAAGGAGAETIYGLKSTDQPAPSAPPTRLFSFSDNGTGFASIANVRLGGLDIDADGLAISPGFGLRAFRVGAAAAPSSQLISIDPGTGAATAIGGVHVGRDIRGAMFDQSDNLWALDARANTLLRIAPTTGAVLSETALSIDVFDGTDLARAADGTVFLVNHDLTLNPPFGRPRFYTIELTTGALTLVFTELANDPAFPNIPLFFPGLAAGSGATASTLFGYEANGFEDIFAYAVPGFSRSAVFTNFISEFNAGRGDLASLAGPAAVPEPPSVALLGAGLVAGWLTLRRAGRRRG